MVDLAAGFVAWGDRLPAGRRVGICTGSGGGGGWMADVCTAAGLEVPLLDAETRARIDAHLPDYGTSQNPVDATAQAVHTIGYAGLAELVAASPQVDSVIVVMTARNSANLERHRQGLARLAAETSKPILTWTYTLPAPASVELLAEAGYPLFTDIQSCARTCRAMADYRALRERFCCARVVVRDPARGDSGAAREALARPAACCASGRRGPVLAAYGIGAAGEAGTLVQSADEAVVAAQAIGCAVALKVQSPDRAQDGGRRGGARFDNRGCRARRVYARVPGTRFATRRKPAYWACWCSRWRRRGASLSSGSSAMPPSGRC